MWRKKEAESRVKYWEIIADRRNKADWSWGCVSAIGRKRAKERRRRARECAAITTSDTYK
jgi:hypothetical protein